MDKLSEIEICDRFITPALKHAGWEDVCIRREYSLTNGRIIVRGKLVTRGKAKRADYVLFYKPGIPLAVIEAKDGNHSPGDGIQQALEYAALLNVPYVFSSNGDKFILQDRSRKDGVRETEVRIDDFPAPDALWQGYLKWKGIAPERSEIVAQTYYGSGRKEPRYYQFSAVNAVVEAIAKGRTRLLLVMATGTGKTYTAFQIIWRLWKGRVKKRILFLADRNVLVDQTMLNDFMPFGSAMSKIKAQATVLDGGEFGPVNSSGRRTIDTSSEIYLGLYQALTGPEEEDKIFKDLSRNFFDLVIVDECHRGSVDDDSAWREILDYFSTATQIGMTATPKQTESGGNYGYFGNPIYVYSLKQGISDGFLAPYKVIRVALDSDVHGFRPHAGQLDVEGMVIPDDQYGRGDFDTRIVIENRTLVVASYVSKFLRDSGDRMQKTIVFCVDQEHADRMRRALVNENPDLCEVDRRYVMRITGEDDIGKAHLSEFIDPESEYPTLVTTSQLLSTGVDVQTCRVIVLDRPVNSMIEFKQILGRGTRVCEDARKFYFTVIDFRGVTKHFADPKFDVDPAQVYEPGIEDSMDPPAVTPVDENGENLSSTPSEDETIVDDPKTALESDQSDDQYDDDHTKLKGKRKKIYVAGVEVTIVSSQVQYLDESGKLKTRSLRDFAKEAIGAKVGSLDRFLSRWAEDDMKEAILHEVDEQGLLLDAVASELGLDLDPFDLICHIVFDRPALTRRDRAEAARKSAVYGKYGPAARAVLDTLLEKYSEEGILNLDQPRILQIDPFASMGSVVELLSRFGGRAGFKSAVRDLKSALYQKVA